jgi:hypothetical protein
MSLVMMVQSVVSTLLYLDARWASEAMQPGPPVPSEIAVSGEVGSE